MAIELNTLTQRLSYIVGENMAHQLKNDGLALDADAVAQAVIDVMADTPSRLTDAEKRSTVEQVQKESQEKQVAAQAEQSAKNQAEGTAYLAENAKKEGVITTDSGLQYKSLVAGDGEKPSKSNKVKVHYRGTLIDGTVFDSSYERGEPIVFPVTGVIAGWIEGLQLMKEGATYRFFIPAKLAYGEIGSGDAIGPNSTLIFDVELLKVSP